MKINGVEIETLTNNSNFNNLIEKNYTSIDSYTINQNNNSISGFIVLNRDEKIPTKKEIMDYFFEKTNNKHMLNRLLLAKILNVPIYLISIEDNFNKCQILELELNKSYNDFQINYFNNKEMVNFEELHELFQNLRNEKRTKPKPLSHISTSDLISKFNQVGINLGGNLDGFFIDKINKKFDLIEFTKIGAKKPDINGKYTLNYNFNKFMSEDFGRWHALETLRNTIEKKYPVHLDVIVWSFSNSYMKIIKDVKFLGNREPSLKGIFKEEFLYKDTSTSTNKIKP